MLSFDPFLQFTAPGLEHRKLARSGSGPRSRTAADCLAQNLDRSGKGGTASIQHSSLSHEVGLSFKNVDPRNFPAAAPEESEAAAFLSLIRELDCAPRDHLNIMELLDISWEINDSGKPWPVLVYRKAPHGDLQTFLESQETPTLSWAQKLRLILDIVRALRYLHTIGVVHGDINPRNILVFEDTPGEFTLKVGDFGYATFGKQDEATVCLPYTRGWAHPTSFRSHCYLRIAKKIETYGLGMVIFWLFFHDIPDYPTVDQIVESQEQGQMLDLARRCITLSTYSSDEKRFIESLLEGTLVHDHEERLGFNDVFRILETQGCIKSLFDPELDVVPSAPAPTTMVIFEFARYAFTLVHVDYRVRSHIVKAMEELLARAPDSVLFKKHATLQLALCYHIGFGVAKDEEKSQQLMLLGEHRPEALSDEVKKLSHHKDLRFREGFAEMWSNSLIRSVDLVEVYRQHPFDPKGLALEAEFPVHQRELRDMTSVLGEDHPLILALKATQACLMSGAALYVDACAEFESIFQTQERLHLDTTETQKELVQLYYEMGQYQKANDRGEALCNELKSDLGEDHLEYIDRRSRLAAVYVDAGELDKAKEIADRNVEIITEKRGEIHPETLSQMRFQSQILLDMDLLDEAHELIDHVIKQQELTLGADHPNTLRSKQILASVYFSKYDFDKCIALEEELLKEWTSRFSEGSQHPDLVHIKAQLSHSHMFSGENVNSEEASKKAMDDIIKVLGPEHPISLEVSDAHVNALMSASKYAMAVRLGTEIHDTASKALGLSSPVNVAIMHTLGTAHRHNGDLSLAEFILSNVAQFRTRIYGELHQDIISSVMQLSCVYSELGQHDEASKMALEAAEATRKKLGPNKGTTIMYELNLAMTYWDLDDFETAKKLEYNAVNNAKASFGLDDEVTLLAMSRLAGTLNKLDEWGEALKYAEPAMQGLVTASGELHEETLMAMTEVAASYAGLGRLTKSRDLYQKTLVLLDRKMREEGDGEDEDCDCKENGEHEHGDYWLLRQNRQLLEAVDKRITEEAPS
ncbi:hypothetical protein F5X68DRAFT_239716 [Plectosphaerella plurivora]|uniref:Protein kinase domain-containing protein n=1 Tax=Plectosphaerella plurivora TaxID=936078 RepID=A0A9P8VB99_9PEZI|nr:hypothetical protein F5X68DRAFT_239716 [Plectosphaerella plurivora]